jgi:hypothetical protein
MRILIMSHNLIERGNYFRALKFAGFLASRGHDVTFMPSSYRWYKPKKYMVGAVRVIESPSWSFVIGKELLVINVEVRCYPGFPFCFPGRSPIYTLLPLPPRRAGAAAGV